MAEELYTVWQVDHQQAKVLLELFAEKAYGMRGYQKSFAYRDKFCFVMDYRQERSLQNFYVGSYLDIQTCETICINFMIECMTNAIPYPILYLILQQRRINLTRDYRIYFDFDIDLTELDKRKNEKHCVNECARILMELLSVKVVESPPHIRSAESSKKAISYHLLKKKIHNEDYDSFTELYKDIQLAAVPQERKKWRINWRQFHRVLLILCAVVGIIAILLLFIQIIWGEFPFFRLFQNTFRQIGTESLLQ